MTPQPGDIIAFLSPIAGKRKYHLHLGTDEHGAVLVFLFINSRSRGADLVLENSDLPMLPPNATGESCVGLSLLLRVRPERLAALQPQTMGSIGAALAARIARAAAQSPALTSAEKALAQRLLAAIR